MSNSKTHFVGTIEGVRMIFEVVGFCTSNLRGDDSQHVVGQVVEGPKNQIGVRHQFDTSLVRWC